MSAEALQGLVDSINYRMRNMLQAQHDNHQMLLQHRAEAHQQLLNKLSQPKEVIRDANGKIVGVK